MSVEIQNALDDLKAALLELKPTGNDGFEGLMATVLAEISGCAYRLASSGSQHGLDGEAVTDQIHICFEGKLYTGQINKNEVLGKLTEIRAGERNPDLWILGATIECSAQIAGTLKSAADKDGIELLILDWVSSSSLPPLAIACAVTSDKTQEFLKKNIGNQKIFKKAKKALDTIKKESEFQSLSQVLTKKLTSPNVGVAPALNHNRQWLEATFSSKQDAKIRFGQALAPLAGPLYERPALIRKIHDQIFTDEKPHACFLLGKEGCGKSWIFTQAWIERKEDYPLTIVIPASAITPSDRSRSIEQLVVEKIIEQTEDRIDDNIRRRWERRINLWKATNPRGQKNLIILLDGVNQKSDSNWGDLIDRIDSFLSKINGMLFVSCRTGYFESNIENRLMASCSKITIPGWSLQELENILSDHGLDKKKIHRDVVESLRNPRILSIALDILAKKQIEDLTELSIDWLLFEHIRAHVREVSDPVSMYQFVSMLSRHAGEIIGRVEKDDLDDALIFDEQEKSNFSIPEELKHVKESRFFEPITDTPELYRFSDEGLGFALGFALIDLLKKADRQSKDLSETISKFIEPVLALDKATEMISSALVVSCLDNQLSRFTADLIESFLRLQNIDDSKYGPFLFVVRKNTEAALSVFKEVHRVDSGNYEHKDWLLLALRQQKDNAKNWNVIENKFKEYLSIYTLNPTLGLPVNKSRQPKEFQDELEKKRSRIEEKIENLTGTEKDYLEKTLIRDDNVDTTGLGNDIFIVLSDTSLQVYAKEFLSWVLSSAINNNPYADPMNFYSLVRFNNRDWKETRIKIRDQIDRFEENNISNVGKWTIISLLRATASTEDSEKEYSLVREVMPDIDQRKGWRLVERYCDSDPCDPGSSFPNNIEGTKEKYLTLPIDEMFKSRSIGSDEHFLRDALPAMVRFCPKEAFAAWQKVGENISDRKPESIRCAILYLEAHAASLSDKAINNLEERYIELNNAKSSEAAPDSNDYTDQFCLEKVFPNVSGDKQLEILKSHPLASPMLLKFIDLLKESSPELMEAALEAATQSGDRHFISSILTFMSYSGAQISERSCRTIENLISSDDRTIRNCVLDFICQTEKKELVKKLVDSGWSANLIDPKENGIERLLGSTILILAEKYGFIDAGEVMNRICIQRYSEAVSALDSSVIFPTVVNTVDQVVSKSLDITESPVSAKIDLHFDINTRKSLPLKSYMNSLAEEEQKHEGVLSFFSEDCGDRAKVAYERFSELENKLIQLNVHEVLEAIEYPVVELIAKNDIKKLLSWAESILATDSARLPWVYNLGVLIAQGLSQTHSAKAVELFKLFENVQPVLRHKIGNAGITQEKLSVWESADSIEINLFRKNRILKAENDNEIYSEILAALMAGKTGVLESFAKDFVESGRPVDIARAFMICGYGLRSKYSEDIMEQYTNVKGFMGDAYKAAKYAYDRNHWASHWFKGMSECETNKEFWENSVLFLKVVDGRFEIWGRNCELSDTAKYFWPPILNTYRNRLSRVNGERSKTLFGGKKIPPSIFISG